MIVVARHGRLQPKRLVVFNRNSWSPSAGVRTPAFAKMPG
jgi:hypothetical protein